VGALSLPSVVEEWGADIRSLAAIVVALGVLVGALWHKRSPLRRLIDWTAD
jgi:hypothetical protein